MPDTQQLKPDPKSPSLRWGPAFGAIGLAVWLVVGTMAAAHAEGITLYKWADEAGVPQFSEHPPAGVDSERITVRTQAPAPAAAGAPPAETAATYGDGEGDGAGEVAPGTTKTVPVPPDPEAVVAARQQNCKAARKELESLSNSPRLRTTGPDGDTTWILGEEREARLDAARAAVGRFCE